MNERKRGTTAAAVLAIAAAVTMLVTITGARFSASAARDQNTNSSTTTNSNRNMNSNMSGNMNMNENMNSNMNSNSNRNMNSNMSGNMNRNMNSNMSGGGTMMMLSSNDRKFMMEAAMGGMAEVEAGRLAAEKATSDALKQYGQKMVDDHTMAGDELKALAASKGVMLPTALDAKHMAMMAKMQAASGADFDHMYLKEMGVKAHEKMEKLFMGESMKGKDADTKAFAAKTLPTVKMHLQMARDMHMSMMGKTGDSKMKM